MEGWRGVDGHTVLYGHTAHAPVSAHWGAQSPQLVLTNPGPRSPAREAVRWVLRWRRKWQRRIGASVACGPIYMVQEFSSGSLANPLLTRVPRVWYTRAMSTEIVTLPPLTQEEDTFAMAVIEYGGNLAAAYRAAFGKEISNPIARARLLISRPEIAKRIEELTQLTQEHALISLGSHLQELAEIRDLSKTSGQLKTALEAEVKRGVVAGFYKESVKSADDAGPKVFISMGQGGSVQIAKSPETPEEWAARQGTKAMIIENPT